MVTHLYDVNDISFVKYRLYYIINWLENKNYRAICVLILNPGCPAAMFVESRSKYSQLSPCGHPAITDNPIIRTADKFRAKINYRHLTKINSRYYGLSLHRTLT